MRTGIKGLILAFMTLVHTSALSSKTLKILAEFSPNTGSYPINMDQWKEHSKDILEDWFQLSQQSDENEPSPSFHLNFGQINGHPAEFWIDREIMETLYKAHQQGENLSQIWRPFQDWVKKQDWDPSHQPFPAHVSSFIRDELERAMELHKAGRSLEEVFSQLPKRLETILTTYHTTKSDKPWLFDAAYHKLEESLYRNNEATPECWQSQDVETISKTVQEELSHLEKPLQDLVLKTHLQRFGHYSFLGAFSPDSMESLEEGARNRNFTFQVADELRHDPNYEIFNLSDQDLQRLKVKLEDFCGVDLKFKVRRLSDSRIEFSMWNIFASASVVVTPMVQKNGAPSVEFRAGASNTIGLQLGEASGIMYFVPDPMEPTQTLLLLDSKGDYQPRARNVAKLFMRAGNDLWAHIMIEAAIGELGTRIADFALDKEQWSTCLEKKAKSKKKLAPK